MVYEIVNTNGDVVMATVPYEYHRENAELILDMFRDRYKTANYHIREVADATGSTRRDGSAMDSDRGRPDAEAVGDGAKLTIREYRGTPSIFYGDRHIAYIPDKVLEYIEDIHEGRIR